MKNSISIYILLISFIFSISASAQIKSQNSDNGHGHYKIKVLTIGPGEELFARFGHIALVVENEVTGRSIVYNFGTFNFTDPKLRIKYARGFLNYWLSTVPLDLFLNFYKGENRDVYLQTLNLTDKQAEDIAIRLDKNAQPENRYYAYRHYLDNCCTRIRNIIDDETGGVISLKYKNMKVERDFRYWTDYSLRGIPIIQSIILYSLGPSIDHRLTRWDEEFLPSVLFEDLKTVKLDNSNKDLVLKSKQIFKREGPPIGSVVPVLDISVIATIILILGLGFILPIFYKKRFQSRRFLGLALIVWSLIAGLGGLMLILYWAVTTHYDTHYNENLIVTPVTHLMLIWPGIALLFKGTVSKKRLSFFKYYLLIATGFVFIDILLKAGPFIQGNYGTIALAAACNLLSYFALKRAFIDEQEKG